MFDLNKYQKEVKLKDGNKILLRPMVTEDQDALILVQDQGMRKK